MHKFLIFIITAILIELQIGHFKLLSSPIKIQADLVYKAQLLSGPSSIQDLEVLTQKVCHVQIVAELAVQTVVSELLLSPTQKDQVASCLIRHPELISS